MRKTDLEKKKLPKARRMKFLIEIVNINLIRGYGRRFFFFFFSFFKTFIH
jgi:hypothetical protein